jgi:F-type H+-transporting ATPase subunit delta
MAEIATIARPYAEAVFGLADEAKRLGEWSGWLRTLAGVVASPEIAALIGNPQITAGQLYELMLDASRVDLPTEARHLIRVLIDNKRLELLPAIRDQFELLKHEREGVVEADVHTAFPLDEAQLAELVAQLERRVKRKVSPRMHVDQELIGGVRVVIGDEVIEASVRGKLAAMAAALAKV